MKTTLTSLFILLVLTIHAAADPVQECVVKAKTFQNPSALAGAAEICMQGYFDSLEADASACRTEAETKPLAGAEFAACQASLILGLRNQIDLCQQEAGSLLKESDELTMRVKSGAGSGCERLVQQAYGMCRASAAEFSGLAESAAITACEAAGL